MATGRIKTWNAPKGYGFISMRHGADDVFCHITAVHEGVVPQIGDTVSFQTELDPKSKRRRACSVYVQPRGTHNDIDI